MFKYFAEFKQNNEYTLIAEDTDIVGVLDKVIEYVENTTYTTEVIRETVLELSSLIHLWSGTLNHVVELPLIGEIMLGSEEV